MNFPKLFDFKIYYKTKQKNYCRIILFLYKNLEITEYEIIFHFYSKLLEEPIEIILYFAMIPLKGTDIILYLSNYFAKSKFTNLYVIFHACFYIKLFYDSKNFLV